jgi:hypothetical protein
VRRPVPRHRKIEPSVQFVGDQQWLPPLRAHSELATTSTTPCAPCSAPTSARQYVFLEPPLFQLRYQLIARADDPAVINSWDDVRKLGAQASS